MVERLEEVCRSWMDVCRGMSSVWWVSSGLCCSVSFCVGRYSSCVRSVRSVVYILCDQRPEISLLALFSYDKLSTVAREKGGGSVLARVHVCIQLSAIASAHPPVGK